MYIIEIRCNQFATFTFLASLHYIFLCFHWLILFFFNLFFSDFQTNGTNYHQRSRLESRFDTMVGTQFIRWFLKSSLLKISTGLKCHVARSSQRNQIQCKIARAAAFPLLLCKLFLHQEKKKRKTNETQNCFMETKGHRSLFKYWVLVNPYNFILFLWSL